MRLAMCDSNLLPIWHRFEIWRLLVQFLPSAGVPLPLCNALIGGEPLHSGRGNMTSENYRHLSIMCRKGHFDMLNCLGVTQEYDRQTDRQTSL